MLKTSNIIPIKPEDTADHVLQECIGKYKDVFVICINDDETESVESRRSMDMTNADIVFLLEAIKHTYLFE